MDVRVGLWRKLNAKELMLLNCDVGEDSWESLGLQGDPTSPSYSRSILGVHWKDWCWNWNSNTLATWCEELTHLKRPWCWERWRAGGEGDDRGWDGWVASLTRWTWVWVNSGSWWWTGRPGVLWFMGSQRVGHDWETELNWIQYFYLIYTHIQVLPTSIFNWPSNVIYNTFPPFCRGSRLGSGTAFSCHVPLASFNLGHFTAFYFMTLIFLKKRISPPFFIEVSLFWVV